MERKVASLRSSLFVPVPAVSSLDELNETLVAKARKHLENAEDFTKDAAAFLPLAEYKPCRLVEAKADKLSLVRFETCSYSVPTRLVTKSLLVRVTPNQIEVLWGREIVATHARSYEKGRAFAQLAHYIDALEKKPRAARCALPVLQAGLPDIFELHRKRVEDGTGVGDLRFVGVLRLAGEYGVQRVAQALEEASSKCLKESSDIRLLILQKAEEPTRCVCTDWKPAGS
ncbi:MAG: Mu transposase domain-containing protein, partial [Polyangiaceae bacterium]